MGLLSRAPGRRPSLSRRRRALFGVATAAILLLAILAGVRLWDEATYSRSQARDRTPRLTPGPGETLRVGCQSRRPEQCLRWYDAELRACWRPGCRTVAGFSTTPQGFVGPTEQLHRPEAPPGSFRILALGGSTTAGMAHGRSWPAALERMLDERAVHEGLDIDFEVLNLGLSGGSSLDSLNLYRAIGRTFHPDLVILGAEVNDFGGCEPFLLPTASGETRAEVVQRYLAGDGELAEVAALSPWFERHQQHYREARLRRIGRTSAKTVMDEVMPRRAQAMEASAGGPTCLRAGTLDLSESSPFDDFHEGWAHTRERYESLLAEIRRDEAATILLSTVPHDFESWACPTPSCPAVIDLVDWRRYLTVVHNPGLRAYAAETGAGLVDLERVFDAFGQGRNPTAAPVAEVFLDHAEQTGATAEEIREGFAAGRLGKRWLFAGEWMHPSDGGYLLVATSYLEPVWSAFLEATGGRESVPRHDDTRPME